MTVRTEPILSRRGPFVVLAVALALLLAGALALLRSADLAEIVQRYMGASSSSLVIFGEIGRASALATALGALAPALLAAGAVASILAVTALTLGSSRVVRVEQRMLWALPAIAAGMLAAGAGAAVDYSLRQGLTGTIVDPSRASAVSITESTIAESLLAAGLITGLVWIAARGALTPASARSTTAQWTAARWTAALWIGVVMIAAAGVLILQVRALGYAELQELYSGFFTGSPDPRVAGRTVLAIQRRDLLLASMDGAALAAAAVGIPLALAAGVLARSAGRWRTGRDRLSPR